MEHLRAALAVWDYCRESAALCFKGSASPTASPDPLYLQLYNAISQSPGIRRSDLTHRFRHSAKADAIGEALTYLASSGMAHAVLVLPEGSGRPVECWFPGLKPTGDGEGDEEDVYRTQEPHPPSAHDPWVVVVDDAGKDGKEGKELLDAFGASGNSLPSSVEAGKEGKELLDATVPEGDGANSLPSLPSLPEVEGDGSKGLNKSTPFEAEGFNIFEPLEGDTGLPVSAEAGSQSGKAEGGEVFYSPVSVDHKDTTFTEAEFLGAMSSAPTPSPDPGRLMRLLDMSDDEYAQWEANRLKV